MAFKDKGKERAYKKAWMAANPQRVQIYNERTRVKRSKNRPALAEKARQYYWSHQEERIAYSKHHRLANPDKVKLAGLKYYWANPERRRAQVTASVARHPENKRLYLQVYRALHPEIDRKHSALRRARLELFGTDLTKEQWATIKGVYNQRCAYCGKPTKRLTLDHVVPLSKGGKTTCSNIVPACMQCNGKKHTSPASPLPAVRLLL